MAGDLRFMAIPKGGWSLPVYREYPDCNRKQSVTDGREVAARRRCGHISRRGKRWTTRRYAGPGCGPRLTASYDNCRNRSHCCCDGSMTLSPPAPCPVHGREAHRLLNLGMFVRAQQGGTVDENVAD